MVKLLRHKNLIVFGLGVLILSCNINDTEEQTLDKLTIEGQIREGEFAEIFLTNAIAFSGVIDSLTIAKSVESKAKVVLTDGETTEVLTLKRDDTRFPFLFYRSNKIKGALNKKYSLNVSIREKEFLSETSIPKIPVINKIEFLETSKDGVLTPEFKDIRLEIENDPNVVSYYKTFIKNEADENFEFARPFITNTTNIKSAIFPLIVNYATFENGFKENLLFVDQTFEIKLISITKEQFDFWKSVVGDESVIVENSSFGQAVTTNISNGAFGYWSGENGIALKVKIPK